MSNSKKVVAVLDLPPRRAHRKTRDSFAAAAERWGAELLWIEQPLEKCHPWWQKMMVCRHVKQRFGDCHLLQLDNDMLIREDCPSPFDLVGPDEFGLIAGRQGIFDKLGAESWAHKVHTIWAKRTGTEPAPPWAHANGGFYIYRTDAFNGMFERILSFGPKYNYDKRYGCDETLIINHLWQFHHDRIRYLPGEFNTLLHHNPHLGSNHAMATYIYHFVGGSKRFFPHIWWRRGKEPPLHVPHAKHSYEIYKLLRDLDRPVRNGVEVGVFHGSTASNLLALLPELELYGVDSWSQYRADDEQPRPDDIQQLGETQTLYWGLSIALRQIAVNAARWHPIRLPSVTAARCFDDGELDFAFVDGEHSYEAVKADVEAWWPKIRPRGLLIGHDYDPERFPGVCRAVDEFCAASVSEVQCGPCSTWSVQHS